MVTLLNASSSEPAVLARALTRPKTLELPDALITDGGLALLLTFTEKVLSGDLRLSLDGQIYDSTVEVDGNADDHNNRTDVCALGPESSTALTSSHGRSMNELFLTLREVGAGVATPSITHARLPGLISSSSSLI